MQIYEIVKELAERQERIKALVGESDRLLALLSDQFGVPRKDTEPAGIVRSEKVDPRIEAALRSMTTKQHAVLQMVVRGASNREIAARFGVGLNTAKIYLRALGQRLDTGGRRAAIANVALPTIEALSETRYRALSGGLPKHWDRDYDHETITDDPYWDLYSGPKVPVRKDEGDDIDGVVGHPSPEAPERGGCPTS